MTEVIAALTTQSAGGLTPASFFGVIADLVPFLVIMIPIALGLTFLRKMIKGASKGKVKF